MRKLLLTIIAVAMTFTAMAANELKWVDATSLNICGHTLSEDCQDTQKIRN